MMILFFIQKIKKSIFMYQFKLVISTTKKSIIGYIGRKHFGEKENDGTHIYDILENFSKD